jgi:hypothetical protein
MFHLSIMSNDKEGDYTQEYGLLPTKIEESDINYGNRVL